LALSGVWVAHAAAPSSAVAKFLAREERPLVSYQARRHLEAHNPRFKKDGWLDAPTTPGGEGFTVNVVASGGSDYVLRHVLLPALEGEQAVLRRRPPDFIDANYQMADDGLDGPHARIRLVPRRRDELLIDGWLIVSPEDAELLEVRGRLVKTPSFWTTRVDL